jgi:hypothetical protein
VLFKKEYKCSVATHGAQAPPADLNADAITQRTAIKTQLRDFYNERYNRRQVDYIRTELPKDGNIGDIIDSNLPMDKWQHTTYEQMNCFYAGKVSHLVKRFNIRLLGCRKVRALFPLRWPMTDTSMSACSVEPVLLEGFRSCVDLIKASTSIIRRFALTILTTNHRSPTKKSRLSSSSLASDTKETTLTT